MKKIIIIFCLVFLSTVAQAAVAPELLMAVDQIYGAQFDAAKNIVTAYMTAYPNDSDGYLLRGMTREWYQFYSFKKDTLNPLIMEDYQKARQLAEVLLQKDPENLEYKMKLANAYVYVSKKQLDSGHKMQAGSSLKQAKNLMLEVLAKDPNNSEAYFAVGLFNYFSDNVPAGYKWLTSLLGFKGDRRLGKDYIFRATTVPNLMKADALYMLYHIAARSEHNYEAALPYMQQLQTLYPQNYIFVCKAAEMEFRTKRVEQARNDALSCFSSCDALGSECNKSFSFVAYYFMTESYINEKNLDMARQYYPKAVSSDQDEHPSAKKALKDWKPLLGL